MLKWGIEFIQKCYINYSEKTLSKKQVIVNVLNKVRINAMEQDVADISEQTNGDQFKLERNIGPTNPISEIQQTHQNKKPFVTLAKEVQLVVPTFKGGRNEATTFELKRFIDSCKLLMELTEAEDKTTLFALIKNRLQIALHPVNTFNEMEAVLLRIYGQKKQLWELTIEVQQCHPLKNEIPKDFLDRLEKLYRLACLEARENYSTESIMLLELEELAEYTFKGGVRETQMALLLHSMRDKSFEVWIDEIVTYDRQSSIHRKTQRIVQRIQDNEQHTGTFKDGSPEITEEVVTREGGRKCDSKSKISKCFQCHGTNHNFKQCIRQAQTTRMASYSCIGIRA